MKETTGVLSHLTAIVMALIALEMALGSSDVQADTPATAVITAAVGPGQSYPEVLAGGEGWFDVGGYCKVVDVGDLSALSSTANGVPVFIPGPTAPVDQWGKYRSSAGTHYDGQLTLTTCCRARSNVATLCSEDGATPIPVSRQYGKLGETDTVTATCTGNNGQYQDSVALLCSGDNGPDGQAAWLQSGPDTPSCTTPPTTTYGACSTAGVGGWGNQLVTVTNCLGQVISQGYTGPACYSAPPCTPNYQFSHCSTSTAIYQDVNNCPGSVNQAYSGGCSLQTDTIYLTCNFTDSDCISNACGGFTCFTDCKAQGNWAQCPAGYSKTSSSCDPEPDVQVTCANPALDHTISPGPCGIDTVSCAHTYWGQN